MKITIITTGSRGDVQPYIALGAGLRKAGHTVCMPSAEVFRDLIIENGLQYIQTKSIDPQEFVQRPEMLKAIKDKNRLRSICTMFREIRPLFEEILNETWGACQGSDAVITSLIPIGASDSAEKLGIPCIHTMLFPASPTSSFQSVVAPSLFNFGAYNKITHKLTEQAVWQPFRPILNKWRKEVLGLEPRNFWGPFRRIYQGTSPVLCGYSSLVVPKPADWPDLINLTGYWFLDEPEDWQPSIELETFLNEGPPPVYIGFGSMADKEPERMTQIAIDALRLSGQRGILSSGWSGLGNVKLPDNVLKVDSIPHSWLFKKMAAIVHHGGAGTTAASLRSGIPSIITPFLVDQPFWGKSIYKLGAGPKPISYHKLSAENLAKLISTCINDKSMRIKAKALGKRIESENGVENAVNIIEKYLVELKK